MNKKITNIKLYIKDSKKAKNEAQIIIEKLQKNGFQINNKSYDLALSIGGDGTFIKMIHENQFNDKIYYSGINAGSLGYLINFETNKVDEFINLLKSNQFLIEEAFVLETIISSSNGKKTINSVNECIIKNNNQLLLKANVYLDGEILEEYTGDGLIISTPNGSTAYNLSYGGPIIDNKLAALTMTSIAPINSKIYKSLIHNLVISNSRKLIIKFNKKENICLINDGKIMKINSVSEIIFKLDKRIKHITLNNQNFATKINEKIIN